MRHFVRTRFDLHMQLSLISTSLLALAAAGPVSFDTRYLLTAVYSGVPEVHHKELKIDSSSGGVTLSGDTNFTVGFPHDQLLVYENGEYTDLSFSVAVTNSQRIFVTNSTNLPTHFSISNGRLEHDFSTSFTVCLDDLSVAAADSEASWAYCKNPLSGVTINAFELN